MDNPRWDTELVFPLAVSTMEDIIAGRIMVTVTDVRDTEDDDMSDVNKSDLGQALVNFSDVFDKGRVTKSSVHLNSVFYDLAKTKNMSSKPKTKPMVRMSIGFFLGEEIDICKMGNGECKNFLELVHLINKGGGEGGENREGEGYAFHVGGFEFEFESGTVK
ncbi:hypothetical protein ScalyP_jg7008 [Parmales sp. scaly parma]|nr:hypothetical protein ScalyP_jg7008 [Parmales sp. scaly parma]